MPEFPVIRRRLYMHANNLDCPVATATRQWFVHHCEYNPIKILRVRVQFSTLDTFASANTIGLYKETGTTETKIAEYVTVEGTGLVAWYDMTMVANTEVVPVGYNLLIACDNNEDVAEIANVEIEYEEMLP